jgi:hypothetical protein
VFTLDSRLHRLLREHLVHRDVLADVPEELQHRDRFGPRTVVDQCGLERALVEVQDARQLRPDGREVAVEGIGIEQRALLRSAAGIPDHPGRATGKRHRSVAEELEPTQQEQRYEVAHVQAVGGGVEARIDRDRALAQASTEGIEVGVVVHQASGQQVFEDLVAGPAGLLGHGGHSPATRRFGPFGYAILGLGELDVAPSARHSERVQTTPIDAEGDERPRRVTPYRVVAVLILLFVFGIWAYALTRPVQPPPDRLDDQSFASEAQEVCVTTVAALDALPQAFQTSTADERASVVSQSNAELEAMLAALRSLVPAAERDQRMLTEWLGDWEIYLGNRQDYVDRLREDGDARIFVAEKDGRQITVAVDRFAEINDMPSCRTPKDVS